MQEGLDLSILAIILSILFWSFVLGPTGAILSVPLTMMVKKIILESTEDGRIAAILISGGCDDSEIKEEIASILEEIGYAGEPGSILYSGDETLKKGENYFLGANPGGHSDERLGKFADTISNQLCSKNSS